MGANGGSDESLNPNDYHVCDNEPFYDGPSSTEQEEFKTERSIEKSWPSNFHHAGDLLLQLSQMNSGQHSSGKPPDDVLFEQVSPIQSLTIKQSKEESKNETCDSFVHLIKFDL